MTCLAPLPLWSLMLGQSGLPVRALVITFGYVFMAGLAGLRAHVLRWIHRDVALLGFPRFLFSLISLSGLRSGFRVRALLFRSRYAQRDQPQREHRNDTRSCKYFS